MLLMLKGLELVNDMSASPRWAGGKATLVMTGDVVDRGHAGKAMWKYLFDLQDDAEKNGGTVVLLLGNHEANLLQGDYQYMTLPDACQYYAETKECKLLERDPRYAEYFWSKSFCLDRQDRPHYHFPGGKSTCCLAQESSRDRCPDTHGYVAAISKEWGPDGWIGREMRRRVRSGGVKLAHRIDRAGHAILFIHAGLDVRWLAARPRLWTGDIAHALQGYLWLTLQLEANTQSTPQTDARVVYDPVDLFGPDGPVWTRVCDLKLSECNGLREVLDTLEVDRLVIGHCPQYYGSGDHSVIPTGRRKYESPGIHEKCGSRFLLTDTRMSIGFTRDRSLSDQNEAAVEVSNNGIWALYPWRHPGCKKIADANVM
uniref:Calcineurin-like phosphoesterase domain-containing protein n=1 Tax=Zooxanthella nutricula TaxID=1333877 RepID=A0A7S2NCV3_9DINO